MKLKNKIYTLLSVFTLVGLTHSLTLKDLNAGLTAPSSYDYRYYWDTVESEWSITSTLGQNTIVLYTRTSDGIYYNYTGTRQLLDGFNITMTFDRSNTQWNSGPGGLYEPGESKIGSDNTVGVATNKFSFTFDNQTNKNYKIYFDRTSTATVDRLVEYIIDTTSYGDFIIQTKMGFYYLSTNNFLELLIPSYSNVIIRSHQTGNVSQYFDAWYLQDLGVSDAYNAGIDAGELIGYDDGYSDGLNNNPNILLNGFQAMVGILVNFMLMILNLEVFNVSIMSVFGILALFVGVIWILKIVRG
jgi:hypothetical protein